MKAFLLLSTTLLLLLSGTPRAGAQDDYEDEEEAVAHGYGDEVPEDEGSEEPVEKPASYLGPSISPAGFVHSNKWQRFRDRLDPVTLQGDTAPEKSFRNLVKHYYDVTEENYPKLE
ncbi:conserved hypothetical protein [Neospora caninum Liverpool]|uniref:Uncharacterized protein n=1 Tax=Neospora caninum (strain Liverpool) TaxID=572307 RepID=F0VK74_NEOCL|nr:conserved hypothetical protein [Neospora caninum Liverpool]CBZ54475.1 conserved hypothetical protein [Neospora caninum Liverpool]CEL69188.1 TPA: hypothetical protein BN1204_049040 [Neospora caninum Liverpool]|eukprot:XP_003884505.1 conserved hypothetical protein [Neospora caninum Liverpool]